jgi:hypothetical protein
MTTITRLVACGIVLALAAPVQAQHYELSLADFADELDAPREPTERTPTRGALFGATLAGGAIATGAAVGATLGIDRVLSNRCEVDQTSLGSALGDALACSTKSVNLLLVMNIGVYPAAIAGGVTLGGHLAGGQGRYDLTLIGSSVGNGFGWLFLMAMARVDTDAAFTAGLAAIPLMQLAGALTAYHLSHRAHRARAQRGRQFGPTFAPVQQGAVVGLAGRF